MTITLPKLTTTHIVLIIAAALIGYGIYQNRRGGGGEGDYSVVERDSHDAIVNSGAEYASMFKAALKKIRRGDIKTDQDLLDFAKENRDKAHERAFAQWNNGIVEQGMPRDKDGNLDMTEVESYIQAIIDGFESVK